MVGIFLIFLVIHTSEKSPDIYFGGANCKKNPFWSQKVPGFHDCINPIKSAILPHFHERRSIIDFRNNTNVIFCIYNIDNDAYKDYLALAKEDAYIRFYYDDYSTNSSLFVVNGNISMIYTHYHFTLGDLFKVVPSKAHDISIKSQFNITFSYEYLNRTVSNDPHQYSVSVFFVMGLSIISIGVAFLVVRCIFESSENKRTRIFNIWIHPRFLNIELHIATFGIQLISCIFLVFVFHFSSEYNPIKLFMITLMGLVPSLVWRADISRSFGEQISSSSLIIPSLITSVFFNMPYSFVNTLSVIYFHSSRSIGFLLSIVMMVFFSFTISIISNGIGKLTESFPSKLKESNKNFISQERTEWKPREFFLFVLFEIIGFRILSPLKESIYEYFLKEIDLDELFIIQTVVVFSAFVCIVSQIRTGLMIYHGEKLWMIGHVIPSFTLAALLGVSEVYRFATKLVFDFHFEACLFYSTGVMAFIGFVGGIGTGVSMVTSQTVIKMVASLEISEEHISFL